MLDFMFLHLFNDFLLVEIKVFFLFYLVLFMYCVVHLNFHQIAGEHWCKLTTWYRQFLCSVANCSQSVGMIL